MKASWICGGKERDLRVALSSAFDRERETSVEGKNLAVRKVSLSLWGKEGDIP